MKKRAFTLAEVLITLGIIGVIAALVMPGLIVKYQKQATAVKLKKAINVYSQAFQLSQVENGPPSEWKLTTFNNNTIYDFANQYIFQYMKTAQTCRSNGGTTGGVTSLQPCGWDLTKIRYRGGAYATVWYGYKMAAILPDGAAFVCMTSVYHNGEFDCYLDINGKAGPNIPGKDVFFMPHFSYVVTGNNNLEYVGQGLDRNTLMNDSASGCNGGNNYCTMLIVNDGWQIKDDYPW